MSYYADSKYVDDPNTPWYKALQLIPDKGKILDVGCSSGNFGQILIDRKNAIVDGIELDKKDAEIARKKLRKVFTLNVETDSLDTLDKDYDIIYFGDVIEHLLHPSHALTRIKPFLKKNGAVVFSIPNMAHISVCMMLLNGSFGYGETGLLDKTHLHYYDKSEVERVFAQANYVIDQIDWARGDVPGEMLKQELSKIGLIPTKKFYQAAKTVEYSAYQFIGRAIPSKKVIELPARKIVSPPIDRYEKHLLSVRKGYEKGIANLQNTIASLQAEYPKKNRAERKVFEDLISKYENSLSWRITKPLRSINKKIGKAKK
ncbi:MAG TPA: class I SAM-dependent methyltransferase [Candidatus Saccharimonadales bacterium]|nr:class I SAM-dependent methyltransferase [Candidatus Saccharimonadales bacterium]